MLSLLGVDWKLKDVSGTPVINSPRKTELNWKQDTDSKCLDTVLLCFAYDWYYMHEEKSDWSIQTENYSS